MCARVGLRAPSVHLTVEQRCAMFTYPRVYTRDADVRVGVCVCYSLTSHRKKQANLYISA